MDVEILVIGAGLSGLHTAYKLEKTGYNYRVIEARNRLGGRILSHSYSSSYANNELKDNELITNEENTANNSAFDLGPSWFWPGQTRLELLAKELKLNNDIFEQYSKGAAIYEDAQGKLEKNAFGISMEGSYRLQGGLSQFTLGLAQHIPQEKILSNTVVTDLEYENNKVITKFTNDGNKETIRSSLVVLALPPRNAMANIQFKPSLESSRVTELSGIPTWMASQAKFVAVYEKPFWREQGFSGDAISQLGPLREIHDASNNGGKENEAVKETNKNNETGYALFGFVGIPASYRAGNQQQIIDACIQQLVRLFGEDAASPIHVSWKDWSTEKFTSTPEDQFSNNHVNHSLQTFSEWNDQLIWSGTETAEVDHARNNGYLEGALESSMRTLELINNSKLLSA
jgi:monoamine oxidase